MLIVLPVATVLAVGCSSGIEEAETSTDEVRAAPRQGARRDGDCALRDVNGAEVWARRRLTLEGGDDRRQIRILGGLGGAAGGIGTRFDRRRPVAPRLLRAAAGPVIAPARNV